MMELTANDHPSGDREGGGGAADVPSMSMTAVGSILTSAGSSGMNRLSPPLGWLTSSCTVMSLLKSRKQLSTLILSEKEFQVSRLWTDYY